MYANRPAKLWDVCSDQEAVDLVRNVGEPVSAAKMLVDHALARFSTDNLSCMVVRFDKQQLLENQNNTSIGVEGDASTSAGRLTEAEKIVTATKQKIAEGAAPAVGISASNSGRGHDPVAPAAAAEEGSDKQQQQQQSASFTPTMIEGPVEEEPSSYDSPEATPDGSVTKMDIDSPAKS